MSRALSLDALAAELDVHYDTVRKRWRRWAREVAFPQPFSLKPLRWRPEAVEAWKQGREAALGAGRAPPAPANDASPLDRRGALRAVRDRSELRVMMGAR